MTLAHPAALLLLAFLPLIWWLHRIASRPRVTRVPSVLPYRDAPPADPRALRRRADLLLVTASAALVTAALAAAAPGFETRPGPIAFLALYDDAWNAAAATGDGTLGRRALERAERALREVVPGVSIETIAVERSSAGASSSEPALAMALARAHAAGAATVVFVSARPERAEGRVPAIGPGVPPLPDWGIEAVREAEDGIAWVTVRRTAAPSAADAERPVALCVDDGPPRPLNFDGAGVSRVAIGAVLRDTPTRLRLTSPSGSPWSDALAADDATLVRRVGGIDRILTSGIPAGPALLRAVAACDVELRPARADDAGSTGTARLLTGSESGASSDSMPTLFLAPAAGVRIGNERSGGGVAVAVGAAETTGADVLGGPGADVLPAPRTMLAAPVRLRIRDSALGSGAEVLWSDALGVLAARGDGWAAIAADPDAPGSTWGGDASLPVLLKSMLDHLGGGPERLLLDAGVGAAPLAPESLELPTRDELLRAVAAKRPPSMSSVPGRVLTAAAALLLLALFGLVSGAGRSRVFRAVRERTAAP